MNGCLGCFAQGVAYEVMLMMRQFGLSGWSNVRVGRVSKFYSGDILHMKSMHSDGESTMQSTTTTTTTTREKSTSTSTQSQVRRMAVLVEVKKVERLESREQT